MSLRDDIESLIGTIRRLTHRQDASSSNSSTNNSNNITNNSVILPMKKKWGPCVGTSGEVAFTSDVNISAISVTADDDNDDDNNDTGFCLARSVVLSSLRHRKMEDDTLEAPPSGDTTALPCMETTSSGGVVSMQMTRSNGVSAAAVAVQHPTVSTTTITNTNTNTNTNTTTTTNNNNNNSNNNNSTSISPVVQNREGDSLQDSSVKPDVFTEGSSLLPNAPTETSSGDSTVLTAPSRQEIKEAYKKLARRLLFEIQRLDTYSAAVSAQCENERKNWLDAHHELARRLGERDALIDSLRQQLQNVQMSSDRVSTTNTCCADNNANKNNIQHYQNMVLMQKCAECTRSVSNGRFLTGGQSDGAAAAAAVAAVTTTTTSDLPSYHRPAVSSELCGMSSSSAAETSSRPTLRTKDDEGIVRGTRTAGGSSPPFHWTAAEDTTPTRPHSLAEFLRSRFSSMGALSGGETRISNETARRLSGGTISARETSLGGSPMPSHPERIITIPTATIQSTAVVDATTTTTAATVSPVHGEHVNESKRLPQKILMPSLVVSDEKTTADELSRQECQCATLPQMHHLYTPQEKGETYASEGREEYELLHHRKQNRKSFPFLTHERRCRRLPREEGIHQVTRSCRACSQIPIETTTRCASAVGGKVDRRKRTGSRVVHHNGKRETPSASQGCCIAPPPTLPKVSTVEVLSGSGKRRGQSRQRMEGNAHENRRKRSSGSTAMLRELVTRSAVMESHLRELRGRVERQEEDLHDVVCFLHDAVRPFTAELREFLTTHGGSKEQQ